MAEQSLVRRAAARRLAEAGCTVTEIVAITGHRTLVEVSRYTKVADQVHLAQTAIDRGRRDSRHKASQLQSSGLGKIPKNLKKSKWICSIGASCRLKQRTLILFKLLYKFFKRLAVKTVYQDRDFFSTAKFPLMVATPLVDKVTRLALFRLVTLSAHRRNLLDRSSPIANDNFSFTSISCD